MSKKIFINLPVKDLELSKAFYTGLGFTINLQFTNEKAACVVISEEIYVMILTEEFFKTFVPNKQISDATKNTEVLLALSADSKDAVNELADKALSSGGKEARPAEDHGFMFTRSFEDPDNHIWEIFWMDMSAAPPQEQS
jgi:uncharacterized protein